MKKNNISAIRNARVLLNEGFSNTDIVIADGKIAAIGCGVADEATHTINATDAWVLPGAVDAHVHFNEPGRTDWEGFETGSKALAVGGTTSFIDMPLNASPPTINVEAFAQKKQAGEANSRLDFALWGGLIPGNTDVLPALADCGVVGFKAFMIDSGIEDFPGVDARCLHDGMRVAARLGLPVAVHAEDAAVVKAASEKARLHGAADARAFLDSRPREAEITAARVALDLAGETGCAVHIVHAGCPEVVHLVHEARALGVDATVEVCYHHALLDSTATDTHGVFAKCAPPLRDAACRDALAQLVLNNAVDGIGSDHSPAPPSLKTGRSFWDAWGGIMGCQHGLLLLAEWAIAQNGESGLATIWSAASSRPATRWGLADRKGKIAEGNDADIILIEKTDPAIIREQDLLYRHQTSPYVGMSLGLQVRHLCLRGKWCRPDGVSLPAGEARFLTRKV